MFSKFESQFSVCRLSDWTGPLAQRNYIEYAKRRRSLSCHFTSSHVSTVLEMPYVVQQLRFLWVQIAAPKQMHSSSPRTKPRTVVMHSETAVVVIEIQLLH